MWPSVHNIKMGIGGEKKIVNVDGKTYVCHVYNSSGTFEVNGDLLVEVLLVGGGGGGDTSSGFTAEPIYWEGGNGSDGVIKIRYKKNV